MALPFGRLDLGDPARDRYVFRTVRPAPVSTKQAGERLAITDLETLVRCEAQQDGLVRDHLWFQEDEVGRRARADLAYVRERRAAPGRHVSIEYARILHRDRGCRIWTCFGRGIGRLSPDMPASRDKTTLDQRPAADETGCRLRRMNVD